MAISTYGVVLSRSATSTGTFEAITSEGIKDFPNILGERSSIETTTLSDDQQTFIDGIREIDGKFNFTMNYNASIFSTLKALEGTKYWFKLTFNDKITTSGSYFLWEGKPSVSLVGKGVNEVTEMILSIIPTSVPSFTTAE